jgi:hypothetical protein
VLCKFGFNVCVCVCSHSSVRGTSRQTVVAVGASQFVYSGHLVFVSGVVVSV